jgi:hypothetical protein
VGDRLFEIEIDGKWMSEPREIGEAQTGRIRRAREGVRNGGKIRIGKREDNDVGRALVEISGIVLGVETVLVADEQMHRVSPRRR